MNEKDAIRLLPNMTDPRQIADVLMDGVNGNHPALIQAAYRRLKEVDRVGAEAFEQVMREKGIKLPPLTMTNMKSEVPTAQVSPKAAVIKELLIRIRADSSNNGLREIMSSGSEAQTIRSLNDDEIKQSTALLRELQAELRTIKTYMEGRMRSFQAGERGPDAGFLMLVVTMFKQLEAAVDEAVSKAPKTGCFVATACYGSYDHPAVRELRWFRDSILSVCRPGRSVIMAYYRISPPLAACLLRSPRMGAVVREYVLGPCVRIVSRLRARSETGKGRP